MVHYWGCSSQSQPAALRPVRECRLHAQVDEHKQLLTVHVEQWVQGATILVDHGASCQLWLAPQYAQDTLGPHSVYGVGDGSGSGLVGVQGLDSGQARA